MTSMTMDPSGNVISVSPPGRPAHGLTYTPTNALAAYTPPLPSMSSAGSTVDEYTPADQLSRVVLPDGREISHSYRPDGKPDATTTPLGTIRYTYSATGA